MLISGHHLLNEIIFCLMMSLLAKTGTMNSNFGLLYETSLTSLVLPTDSEIVASIHPVILSQNVKNTELRCLNIYEKTQMSMNVLTKV